MNEQTEKDVWLSLHATSKRRHKYSPELCEPGRLWQPNISREFSSVRKARPFFKLNIAYSEQPVLSTADLKSDTHTGLSRFCRCIFISAAVFLKSIHVFQEYRSILGKIPVNNLQHPDKVEAAFSR